MSKEKSLNNSKIVIMAEGGNVIYKADFFNNKAESLSKLYVLFRTEDKKPDAVVYAQKAFWKNNSWKLENIMDVMRLIGRKRGAIISGGNIDENKTANILIKDFRDAKIGRITLETI